MISMGGKLQAQVRRSRDELAKCLADKDFQGAAEAQRDIAALVNAATGSRSAAPMRVEEVDEENDERQTKRLNLGGTPSACRCSNQRVHSKLQYKARPCKAKFIPNCMWRL